MFDCVQSVQSPFLHQLLVSNFARAQVRRLCEQERARREILSLDGMPLEVASPLSGMWEEIDKLETISEKDISATESGP